MHTDETPKGGSLGLRPLGQDRESRGYFILCGFLFTLLALAVVLPERGWTNTVVDLTFILALVSAGYSVSDSRSMTSLVVVLGAIMIAFAVLRQFTDPLIVHHLAGISASVFLITVTIALGYDVVTSGHGRGVSPGLIAGATAVYLLIALTFARLYGVAEAFDDRSLEGALGADGVVRLRELVYFSFITMTTVGYGEITPATGPARFLAVIEALTGQLYLTILVARLVGIQIAQSGDSGDQPPNR